MRFQISGAAILAALVLFVGPVSAQELALSGVRATSPNPEFPEPRGFAITAQIPTDAWLFRLGYVRFTDETTKSGTVCQVYSPRIGCGTEQTSTSAGLSGLRLGVLRTIGLASVARLEVGGGLSFSLISADVQGVSGRAGDLHRPNAGQIGYLGTVSVAVAPIRGVPLRLIGGFSAHWVSFHGCVDPADPTSGYAPFCGTDLFREFSLGLAYDVSRLLGR